MFSSTSVKPGIQDNARINKVNPSHTLSFLAICVLLLFQRQALLLPFLFVSNHTHLPSLPASLTHCSQERDCTVLMKQDQQLILPGIYAGTSPGRLRRTPHAPGDGWYALTAHDDWTRNGWLPWACGHPPWGALQTHINWNRELFAKDKPYFNKRRHNVKSNPKIQLWEREFLNIHILGATCTCCTHNLRSISFLKNKWHYHCQLPFPLGLGCIWGFRLAFFYLNHCKMMMKVFALKSFSQPDSALAVSASTLFGIWSLCFAWFDTSQTLWFQTCKRGDL